MERDELKRELTELAALVKKFPETIQAKAFELLTQHLAASPEAAQDPKSKPGSRNIGTKRVKPAPAATTESGERKTKRSASKESYSIDRNLNLRGDKSIPSFKDFVTEKIPGSSKEFNAVAVYYLVKLLGIETASLDQAYTCYSEVRKKPPEHFRQSFTDTKNKEGWVEFDEQGRLKIPHRGVVFVEHDLPRPTKPTK